MYILTSVWVMMNKVFLATEPHTHELFNENIYISQIFKKHIFRFFSSYRKKEKNENKFLKQ